jgi:hypothetical protein
LIYFIQVPIINDVNIENGLKMDDLKAFHSH